MKKIVICSAILISFLSGCGREIQPIPTQPQILVPTQTAKPSTATPTFTATKTPTPSPLPTETETPTATPYLQVWVGKYYENDAFIEPFSFERVDEEIAFDWGSTAPFPDFPEDSFSIAWEKCMNFEEQYYIFKTQTSNSTSLKIFLNDLPVLESRYEESTESTAEFYAPAGRNCLTVKLSHQAGSASVWFEFEPSKSESGNVGSSWDWKGKYYPNDSFTEPFTVERFDDEILFDWGAANPAPNIPRDNFSVVWEKCILFEPRFYTFTAQTNANTKLDVILNNIWIMESGLEETEEKTIDFYGPAGNHCVEVKLTHSTGDAFVQFSFE